MREFYAIDPATAADETQLNQKALLGRVLSVQKRTDDQPQILIYHTHSQEAFTDSIPGNAQTGIMGVGEVLAEILRKQYGYNVMHHMGQYDVEKRDYAYSNSLPALEAILKENPSIEVVIDLHRDEVAEGTRLVTEIGGKKWRASCFSTDCPERGGSGTLIRFRIKILRIISRFRSRCRCCATSITRG